MVLDRVEFINDFLHDIDSDRKMKIVRDCFVNVMSCYDLACSCNAVNAKIISHSDQYDEICLEILTDNKTTFEQFSSIIKELTDNLGGLLFKVYDEKFCAMFISDNIDELSITIKIYKTR